jgi:hypothetical protein
VADRWKRLNLARTHERRQEHLAFPRLVAGYLVITIGAIGLAIGGRKVLGVDPIAITCAVIAVVYLLAAAQRPRIVYLVLRNGRWFSKIDSVPLLRVIMALVGIALLLAGVYLQFRWLVSGTWL